MFIELQQFFFQSETLQASRSLKWLSSVGMVDIELEFEDRQLEISVNPLQASIIYHFQDEGWYLIVSSLCSTILT